MLSELQLDALTELVNLGVSKAALSLHDMVREEVCLSVPTVSVCAGKDAVSALGQGGAKNLVCVHQDFAGELKGRAILLFPEGNSMELVRALTGGDLSAEEIVHLESEALTETGNILLNACLSTIANSLQKSLRISLPELIYSDSDDFSVLGTADTATSVLFIRIDFAIRSRSVNGYIAMLLDLPSLVALGELLNAFIIRATGLDSTAGAL